MIELYDTSIGNITWTLGKYWNLSPYAANRVGGGGYTAIGLTTFLINHSMDLHKYCDLGPFGPLVIPLQLSPFRTAVVEWMHLLMGPKMALESP